MTAQRHDWDLHQIAAGGDQPVNLNEHLLSAQQGRGDTSVPHNPGVALWGQSRPSCDGQCAAEEVRVVACICVTATVLRQDVLLLTRHHRASASTMATCSAAIPTNLHACPPAHQTFLFANLCPFCITCVQSENAYCSAHVAVLLAFLYLEQCRFHTVYCRIVVVITCR